MFNWRKKREKPSAQFRVKPDGDFARVELLVGGEALPFADWAVAKPEASMAVAELKALDERLQDDGAQGLTFLHTHILMPADAVAQIADSELMPPTIPRNSRPGFRADPAHHSD